MAMQCGIRWAEIVLIAALFSGNACAAAAQTAQSIDVLRAYEGMWSVEIEHFDTAQSKASHEKTTLRNECWKSGGYFACNQFVDGESKMLLVFTYNAKDKVYTSTQVPPNGGQPGSGRLSIDGNVWTFPWQQGEGDKATYFRVVNVFTSADHIEFRQEFSTDKIHWTVMAKGVESRTAAK